jgi:hypothetical protein
MEPDARSSASRHPPSHALFQPGEHPLHLFRLERFGQGIGDLLRHRLRPVSLAARLRQREQQLVGHLAAQRRHLLAEVFRQRLQLHREARALDQPLRELRRVLRLRGAGEQGPQQERISEFLHGVSPSRHYIPPRRPARRVPRATSLLLRLLGGLLRAAAALDVAARDVGLDVLGALVDVDRQVALLQLA